MSTVRLICLTSIKHVQATPTHLPARVKTLKMVNFTRYRWNGYLPRASTTGHKGKYVIALVFYPKFLTILPARPTALILIWFRRFGDIIASYIKISPPPAFRSHSSRDFLDLSTRCNLLILLWKNATLRRIGVSGGWMVSGYEHPRSIFCFKSG